MAGTFETLKTVLAGMLGVRRKAAHESASLNPAHVIIAGIALAAMFVIALISIVRIVVG
jgi:hypothetical protein